jgi:phage terminase large subunit
MTEVKLRIPPKLIPVFTGPAMYRGAWGGRGSGKTRTFAKMAAVRGLMFAQEGRSGIIVGAREYMNSLDESSMAEIKAAIKSEPWLAANYEMGEKFIRTKDRRVEFDFIGLRHNLDSIKSKSQILILWADEAEPISETAWEKTDPTVREEGAEVWATWNPENKRSAVHKRFRLNPPPHSKFVEINWRDNPWFPSTLEIKRRHAELTDPDNYEHVWEGAFKTVYTGAYYAKQLTAAKTEGRIGIVPADPLMTYRLIADIGGTGANADNFVFWVAQFVGLQIRWLDHYEVQGQPISAHLEWMRSRGYNTGNTEIFLPHDGDNNERVYDVSYKSAFEEAGYNVTVIPNQGKGAAMLRVEASRRRFSSMWFNAATTEAGRDALSAYAPKIDKDRNIDLGPDHNWASHSSDAFGMGSIIYELPKENKPKPARSHVGAGSWMG